MVEALMAVSVPGCVLMSSSDVRFEPGRVTSAKLRSAGIGIRHRRRYSLRRTGSILREHVDEVAVMPCELAGTHSCADFNGRFKRQELDAQPPGLEEPF